MTDVKLNAIRSSSSYSFKIKGNREELLAISIWSLFFPPWWYQRLGEWGFIRPFERNFSPRPVGSRSPTTSAFFVLCTTCRPAKGAPDSAPSSGELSYVLCKTILVLCRTSSLSSQGIFLWNFFFKKKSFCLFTNFDFYSELRVNWEKITELRQLILSFSEFFSVFVLVFSVKKPKIRRQKKNFTENREN